MRKIEIRFEVQVFEGSREEKMLDYLKSKRTPYPFKDMAMIALKGHVMPYAYRDDHLAPLSEKVQVIQDSLHRLQIQEQCFKEMLAALKADAEVLSGVPVSSVVPEPTANNSNGSIQEDIEPEKVWDPYEDAEVHQ